MVLLVFSTSYLLRFVYDEWVLIYLFETDDFYYVMVSNASTIIFDIVPIGLVMYYHYRNFKKVDQHYLTMDTKTTSSTLRHQETVTSTVNESSQE